MVETLVVRRVCGQMPHRIPEHEPSEAHGPYTPGGDNHGVAEQLPERILWWLAGGVGLVS